MAESVDRVIVGNPEADQSTIRMIIEKTKDAEVLKEAIDNPNATKETLEAVIKRVKMLYAQGIIGKDKAAELVGWVEFLLDSMGKEMGR